MVDANDYLSGRLQPNVNVFEVPQPRVPVNGTSQYFPQHRVYCIGRNYADHVREMGGEPERTPPVYFLKPADAVVTGTDTIEYPPRTADLHHEVELVVAIGKGGRNISAAAAEAHIYGYAVGIDLTRRDLQNQAKATAGPWDVAKSFEQAAPMSAIHTAAEVGHPANAGIWLEVNGERRQQGELRHMIWSVAEALADLSTYVTLAPGDLLFTGTPAGVGALRRGDHVRCGVEGVAELAITMV